MNTDPKLRIPDMESLMLPILNFLGDGAPHSYSETEEHLANKYHLTEEVLRLKVPSGQMGLFKNRIAWSVSYLKNSGLVFYPRRAVYQLTDTGKSVVAQKPDKVNIHFLKQFEAYRQWKSSISAGREEKEIKTTSTSEESGTPEEVIGNTFRELNEKLAFELLELIKQKKPWQFERFVLELLNKMGYGGVEERNFEVVGQSGDNGIDGIIYQDKLGLDRIYVQAKKWADNKVQSKDIRDFIGSLSLKGTNKGVFITTSQFTSDAINTVKMNPQNIIILIDGKQLTELAIKFNVGVQVKETFEIKNLDMDFFEEL